MRAERPAGPIKVAVVEDREGFREGLERLLRRTPGFELTGAFASMEEALPALAQAPPDVLLSDIGLPGLSGIEGVRELKRRSAGLQVLMLTVYEDDAHVFEAVCAGASGYLLKDAEPERIREAVREVHGGGAPMTPRIARKVLTLFRDVAPPRDESARLSPRELELLKALAEGHSYKTAADALGIAMDTVRTHIRSAYEKLHAHSKSEAVSKAFKSGLLR
jgi:DNA-binding NarL/FixJ family response regulator